MPDPFHTYDAWKEARPEPDDPCPRHPKAEIDRRGRCVECLDERSDEGHDDV